MYALVKDSKVVEITYGLNRVWFDGERWWDFREGQMDPADAGWREVVETERPETTDTETYESSVVLVDGVPTREWVKRALSEDEIRERTEQQVKLDDIYRRLELVEAHLWPPADPEVDPPADVPAFSGVWHSGTLISDGGKIWRNVTNVPLTASPTQFPGTPSQWSHLFVEVTGETDPEDPTRPDNYVGDWSAQATYKVGDVVSHSGEYWRCEIAHGTEYQGAWAPGLAHNVWTSIGTV